MQHLAKVLPKIQYNANIPVPLRNVLYDFKKRKSKYGDRCVRYAAFGGFLREMA